MAQFQLTATSDINRCNGFHMDKGTTINININMAGITPYNLINNSRCQEALVQQFFVNGIDLPRTDAVFSRSYWDIMMVESYKKCYAENKMALNVCANIINKRIFLYLNYYLHN